MLLKLCCVAGVAQIFAHHQRHLKNDGVVEFAQVESRCAFDLVQAVDQRVAVDKEFSGRLGDVQVVFEKFIDGK